MFHLSGHKEVYWALYLAALNIVNISVWQVNDGGQYQELEAVDEQ